MSTPLRSVRHSSSRVRGLWPLVSCLWSLAFACPLAFAAQPTPPPLPAPIQPKVNVLFLIADDLNTDLGCYGAQELVTPHIDRLAARGVRFDRAYCQFPLCAPSRASFLTGRRPNATGVVTNPGQVLVANPFATHFRAKLPDTVTLPQLFKRHGIFAARVGKLYHYGVPLDLGTSSADDYFSWDQVVNPRGRDREQHDKIFSLTPGQFGGSLSWLADGEGEDNDHTDGLGATEAIRLLERFKRDSRPFFLAVGFYRPHTPYVAPRKYFDLYPANKITLPSLSADDRARPLPAAWGSALAVQDKMTDDLRRQAIQAYRASTSYMDAQVGRVTEALDRLGLAQNTVVVLTSDHGYHLGDHGLWQKQSLFERSARVPLIVAAPGARANGRAARGVVELVDLYPTLAALAGLPAPAYLDGTDLSPMLADATASVKPGAFSQVRRGESGHSYSVRSGQWRYTEWANADGSPAGTQLFDEDSDPAETKNLAADPTHAATVKQLAALLVPIKAQK